MIRAKPRFVIRVGWLIILFISLPTGAYFLPSTFILREYAESRRNVSLLDASGTITLFDDTFPADGLTISYAVRAASPGDAVEQFQFNDLTIQRSVRGDRLVEWVNGQLSYIGSRPVQLYYLPFNTLPVATEWSRRDVKPESRLIKLCEQAGIDLAVRSYNRWHGTIVHVLGAKPDRPFASQLWLDKSSLQPILWIGKEFSGDLAAISQVNYRYHRPQGKWRLFPDEVVVKLNDLERAIIEFDALTLNPKPDSKRNSLAWPAIKHIDSDVQISGTGVSRLIDIVRNASR